MAHFVSRGPRLLPANEHTHTTQNTHGHMGGQAPVREAASEVDFPTFTVLTINESKNTLELDIFKLLRRLNTKINVYTS